MMLQKIKVSRLIINFAVTAMISAGPVLAQDKSYPPTPPPAANTGAVPHVKPLRDRPPMPPPRKSNLMGDGGGVAEGTIKAPPPPGVSYRMVHARTATKSSTPAPVASTLKSKQGVSSSKSIKSKKAILKPSSVH
jgi:hypothetical protein